MAVLSVRARNNFASNTDRIPSPALWWDFYHLGIISGETDGIVDGDDFIFHDVEDAVDTGGYQRYIDTGNTIRLLATSTTVRGGVLRLLTDATDNDSPVIQRRGANAGSTTAFGPYIIGNTLTSATTRTNFPLWFECRVKRTSIVDDVTAFFIGLGQCTDLAADNGILEDDTGDVVDSKSFLGFRTKHLNGGTAGQNALIDFIYQDSANTAPTVAAASVATSVADTFMRLGFKYDPNQPAATKLKIFVDGLEQSTYVTTALIDATAFPEDDAMNFCAAQKNGSGTAGNFDIDWWKCGQIYS